jgi:hypothetical protein
LPDKPAPEGACKDEVYAAVESTSAADINSRFYNLTYAAGLAIQVTDCDGLECPFECNLCTPAPGSGSTGDSDCHPRESGSEGS